MTNADLSVVRNAELLPIRAKRTDREQPLLEVRFSPFDVWYEIDSIWEGRFLERTARGAFADTIANDRDSIRALFNHGLDPQIGDKVLGTIADLREDPDAAVGEVKLFDASYVRDLLPGLEAGVYGSSMRMRVIKDHWNEQPGTSKHNPHGIPERTITQVRLFEFGPVTFPANHEATAGVRSATDDYYDGLRTKAPHQLAKLERSRSGLTATERARHLERRR